MPIKRYNESLFDSAAEHAVHGKNDKHYLTMVKHLLLKNTRIHLCHGDFDDLCEEGVLSVVEKFNDRISYSASNPGCTVTTNHSKAKLNENQQKFIEWVEKQDWYIPTAQTAMAKELETLKARKEALEAEINSILTEKQSELEQNLKKQFDEELNRKVQEEFKKTIDSKIKETNESLKSSNICAPEKEITVPKETNAIKQCNELVCSTTGIANDVESRLERLLITNRSALSDLRAKTDSFSGKIENEFRKADSKVTETTQTATKTGADAVDICYTVVSKEATELRTKTNALKQVESTLAKAEQALEKRGVKRRRDEEDEEKEGWMSRVMLAAAKSPLNVFKGMFDSPPK